MTSEVAVPAAEQEGVGQVDRDAESRKATGATAQVFPKAEKSPTSKTKKQPEEQSEAERISRLQRTIDADEAQLKQIKDELKKADAEFEKAEKEFEAIETELEKKKKAKAPRTELQALEKNWNRSKDRFQLAIDSRKTLQEKIATFQEKIANDKKALAKLKDEEEPKHEEGQEETAPQKGQPPPADTEPSEPKPAGKGPLAPFGKGAPKDDRETKGTALPPTEAESKELIEARQQVQKKDQEASSAAEQLQVINEQIVRQRRLIKMEEKTLEQLKKKADLERDTLAGLKEPQKITEQEQVIARTLADITKSAERLSALQAGMQALEEGQRADEERAVKAKREADWENFKLTWFQAPIEWFKNHGLKILLILIAMAVLRWLARKLENRIVAMVACTADHGTAQDRVYRAKTLAGVFHNAAAVAIFVGGALLILFEINREWMVPLMTALGVVGIAVGLGTQNLIKDYFCGFVMLLENQYTVNDVVKICGIGGLVERITLRMTVLRDLEGTVHFIPHGQITTVSNMTHGWSRALFEIGVAYKEDVDHVMNVLTGLGKELRQDPAFSHLILDDPQMLGVDAMGDSAVVIKFFIKTRTLQQWTVKRELLRRIKNRFDELGIEIPFPHRTIYHRYEDTEPAGDGSVRMHRTGQPAKVEE